MKWIVFGGRGWIGEQFVEVLRDRGDDIIIPTVRADDAVGVASLLDAETPDRVVSLVGRTHGPGHSTIDYLEQPGTLVENVRDNLYGPCILAHACDARNIHVTYLGTGCIFSYDDDTAAFTEDDDPTFFGSSYSVVKGYTDQMMRHMFPNALNVRIRMPITADRHPRNFITKITTYAKICSVPNSMTVLPELVPIMVDMAVQGTTGTVNLTNPGTISHDEILEMYRDIVDPSFTWVTFSEDDQRRVLAADRSNNRLDTAVLERLYPHVRPIRDAVRAVLLEMARDDTQSPS
jgi:3,5-epimerase/4-reductase